MKFYNNLYVGESAKGSIKKICRNLKQRRGQLQVYIVALSSGEDQLEIYHCAFLKQKYYKKHSPFIVGIAKSYEEAQELVVQMIEDALQATGNANVKSYIMNEKEK